MARSAALAASGAALLAAAVTTALGAFLLQAAEDRRLREAGLVLVIEISEVNPTYERVAALVRREHEETRLAGIRFAVATQSGTYVTGDEHFDRPPAGECWTNERDDLRMCSVLAKAGLVVTAASTHAPQTPLFLLPAGVAVVLAGAITWLSSRPVARAAISPFSRLQARVADIDVDTLERRDLGPSERVLEVDELRTTIAQLIERLAAALEQAQTFAANAAHELRTPLTAVRAELELLTEQTAHFPDAASSLAAVRGKLAALSLLVERLLVLATPKNVFGQATEVVSLRDMMEDVRLGLSPDEMKRVDLPDEDALVRGDSVLLTTMFANGLSNALKFGCRVRVDLIHSDGRAVIIIDDDGPGIDPALRESLFEPFVRGRDALRRRLPGHGLGLALVRHVAQSHGGGARFAPKSSPGARLQIELAEVTNERLDQTEAILPRVSST